MEKKIVWQAQKIILNIVYEDKYILVINKHSNIIAHPGNKNKDNTIFNAILYYYPYSRNIPRAGIIHRLDKDTTGLMIIAKNMYSYFFLKQELKNHNIIRNYEAIVNGVVKNNEILNLPIKCIYKKNNIHMSVHPSGKTAITKIFIKNNFKNFTHLKIQLKTGRTHQIRVHLSYIKHNIIGDKIYKNYNITNQIKFYEEKIKKIINRQALHAYCIKFIHPFYKTYIKLNTILPDDINNLISFLNNVNM